MNTVSCRRGRRRRQGTAILLGATACLTQAQAQADAGGAAHGPLDARRSLAVTEVDILERFPLRRVLDQLISQSDVPNLSALELFRRWWDSQNPRPGMIGGPHHCDDQLDSRGEPALNGFPYACRPGSARHEGLEATSDPFTAPETNPAAYEPVGLFNRFDLAPADGSHCGEYRIAYARRSGKDDPTTRNFILFEAALPNPRPHLGLQGCRPIAMFWAALSKENDLRKRARRLESFYFEGIEQLPPVVHVDHYGSAAGRGGQIRTNQFMVDPNAAPRVWSLREFRLVRSCAGPRARTSLSIVPTTAKNNPYGPLFSSVHAHPVAAHFQERFLDEVAALAADSLDKIGMATGDGFNSAQAQASGSTESDYVRQFASAPAEFRSRIEAALPAGSSLTVEDVVARARAMSCAGCHRFNSNVAIGGGLTWPASLGFTHVSEQLEPGAVPARHPLSPALLEVFLPARQRLLEAFVENRPLPARRPKDPIGSRRVH